MSTLKERIDSYQESYNFKLLPKLPIIVILNGRSFSKITSLLDKPYDQHLSELFAITMSKVCSEIEGAFFAYHHNDEIVILLRNDQSNNTVPWLDNKIQKICSITSSLATKKFNEHSNSLNLIGEAIFTSQVFAAPNLSEAINTIVCKQQQNFHTSIQFSCFYELLKKHDKNTIREMLHGLNLDEKIDLLRQEGIEFNNYPLSFRRGIACYRAPKINDGIIKSKWIINKELPIFTKDQSFLSNIFKFGQDLFREINV